MEKNQQKHSKNDIYFRYRIIFKTIKKSNTISNAK